MRDQYGSTSVRKQYTPAERVRPSGNKVFSRAPIKPTFIRYSKVLANRPLARGERCEANWHVGRDGRATALLPGENKVRLRLAPGRQRCPTAFDENLKVVLLALCRMCNSPQQDFASYRSLLSVLGYSATQDRNVAKLKDSLDYLSRLSLEITYGEDTHRLPPVIESYERQDDALRIRVSEGFYELSLGSGKPVAELPLALPTSFVAQNLLMLMAASRWNVEFDEETGEEEPWKSRPLMFLAVLARKVGLNHNLRNRDLRRAMEQVSAAYEAHGGKLEFVPRIGANVG